MGRMLKIFKKLIVANYRRVIREDIEHGNICWLTAYLFFRDIRALFFQESIAVKKRMHLIVEWPEFYLTIYHRCYDVCFSLCCFLCFTTFINHHTHIFISHMVSLGFKWIWDAREMCVVIQCLHVKYFTIFCSSQVISDDYPLDDMRHECDVLQGLEFIFS